MQTNVLLDVTPGPGTKSGVEEKPGGGAAQVNTRSLPLCLFVIQIDMVEGLVLPQAQMLILLTEMGPGKSANRACCSSDQRSWGKIGI
jgi:hypothetical protein